MNTDKTYLSDVITDSQIKDWIDNKRLVVISTATGTGKTHFIINKLTEQEKKILYLVPRRLIKENIVHKIKNKKLKKDIIEARTTQSIEKANTEIVIKDLQNIQQVQDIEKADNEIIVIDEAHLLFTDSDFNTKTSIIIEKVIKVLNTKTIILITATANRLNNFLKNNNIESIEISNERLQQDYSKHNLYFADNRKDIELLINYIMKYRKAEKIIYFSEYLTNIKNLYNEFITKSICLCSQYNSNDDKNKARLIQDNQKYVKDIIVNHTLSQNKKILFATECIEAGIDILDDKIKWVFCDNSSLDSLIQCIGRVRTEAIQDKINVIVLNKQDELNIKYDNCKSDKQTMKKVYEYYYNEKTLSNTLDINEIGDVLHNYDMMKDKYFYCIGKEEVTSKQVNNSISAFKTDTEEITTVTKRFEYRLSITAYSNMLYNCNTLSKDYVQSVMDSLHKTDCKTIQDIEEYTEAQEQIKTEAKHKRDDTLQAFSKFLEYNLNKYLTGDKLDRGNNIKKKRGLFNFVEELENEKFKTTSNETQNKINAILEKLNLKYRVDKPISKIKTDRCKQTTKYFHITLYNQ